MPETIEQVLSLFPAFSSDQAEVFLKVVTAARSDGVSHFDALVNAFNGARKDEAPGSIQFREDALIPLEPPSRTPEGFLRCDARLTRTGVFKYKAASELRTAEEVFHPQHLESINGNPITIHHPKTGLLTPETVQDNAVGSVFNPRQDEDGIHVRVTAIINTKRGIEAVKDGGLNFLSHGYRSLVVPSRGEHKGERFDAIQLMLRGNHVALTDQPRAGKTAEIRADEEEKDKMDEEITIGGVKFKVPTQVAQAMRADEAKRKEREDAKDAELAKAQGERDAVKAKLDEVEKDRTDSKEDESLKARMALALQVAKLLGEQPEDLVKLDEAEIKAHAVQKKTGADMTGKHPEYVNARFDSLVEAAGQETASSKVLGALHRTDETKEAAADPKAARAEMIKRSRDAWKREARKTN